MKLLIYNTGQQLNKLLLTEAAKFTNLKVSLARQEASPITLQDYDLLLLAPWHAKNETAQQFSKEQLELLVELSQIRQAKLIALLPSQSELTNQADKKLLTKLKELVAKQQEFFILETSFEVAVEELARVSLACIAQLAAGAKAWGSYTYTQNLPNPLLETFGIHPINEK